VDELEWSVRTYNCLKSAQICTLSELVRKTEADLLRSKNFGRKSLNEIQQRLADLGLRLGMRDDEDDEGGITVAAPRRPDKPHPSAPHGGCRKQTSDDYRTMVVWYVW
jgi:DNA-directed RNA polymerase subunit alpha